MDFRTNSHMMEFNSKEPNIIHLDINSCFATIEQQANPNLRGKPIVVVAYDSPGGCILASSIEAKKLGIKTGMRLLEGKKIYSNLIPLLPDPPKYRYVHKKIKRILDYYSPKITPKSIDEFVFENALGNPLKISKEIKERIKKEIGENITVSIGISTNEYLAKIASNLQKPDGLVGIDKNNFLQIFKKLRLTDLTGIKLANKKRLNLVGIRTVLDFYNCPIWKEKIAFGGIVGFYWHLRLKGYEIDSFEKKRSTFGNSFAPPGNMVKKTKEILSKLCQKTGFRLRKAGYGSFGVHLSIVFRNGKFWHKGKKTKEMVFENGQIYKEALRLLNECPVRSNLKIIAINVFNLVDIKNLQLNFFKNTIINYNLAGCIDKINKKWGDFTIFPARTVYMENVIKDRIAFGK